MGIATLIAAGLTLGSVSAAADALAQAGLQPGGPVWMDADEACDFEFEGTIDAARDALAPFEANMDVFVQPHAHRAKRLLVADMDSTMITVECIDELADYAGVKAEVAAITERAMRGELNFTGALRARVALLAGLPVGTMDACYAERVRTMPGAATLVATMRARSAETLLVSGGFTAFADRVGAALGFDVVVANVLGIADGFLTGEVTGAIVDGARKAAELDRARTRLELRSAEVIAVGDGANDAAMVRAAGLGVAFRAKPVLAQAADARVVHGDLTTLLWAQGFSRRDWVPG